jgi:hypothetical protein
MQQLSCGESDSWGLAAIFTKLGETGGGDGRERLVRNFSRFHSVKTRNARS